jgi:DNA repair protein RecO
MSYHLYSTEGFILSSNPLGEADRGFSILTRELGLILATAKSVRNEKAKLASGLQDLSISQMSFIRGRQKWKITSAVCIDNIFVNLREDKEKLFACARIFKLLEQLIAGEEVHTHFFDVIRAGIDFLKNNNLAKADILLWESILVARILFNLGYLAEKDFIKPLFDDLRWDDEVLSLVRVHKTQVVRDINESLLATQLSK